MPAISLSFSAAGGAGWFPTGDVGVTGFAWAAGTSSAAALSYDEAVSVASLRAPSANGSDRNLISLQTQGNPPARFQSFPVAASQGVFVSVTAAGTATIYFDFAT